MAVFDPCFRDANEPRTRRNRSVSPESHPTFSHCWAFNPLRGASSRPRRPRERQHLALISYHFWQSSFWGLARCDRRDDRARRCPFSNHRYPSCRFSICPAQRGCVGTAHGISGLGKASRYPWLRFVVRRCPASTERDVRAGPGGDERDCTPSRRAVAGIRTEPGH